MHLRQHTATHSKGNARCALSVLGAALVRFGDGGATGAPPSRLVAMLARRHCKRAKGCDSARQICQLFAKILKSKTDQNVPETDIFGMHYLHCSA